MIPDDFRKLIEGPANVTLEVDETTAAYPWEMAGCRKIAGALSFVGTNVAVSRQFRTVLSPPADVAAAAQQYAQRPDHRRSRCRRGKELPGARKEAEAVVEVLQRAQDAWGGQYTVTATVRVGSCGAPDNDLLQKASGQEQVQHRAKRRMLRSGGTHNAAGERPIRPRPLCRPWRVRSGAARTDGCSPRIAFFRPRRSSASARCRAWCLPMPVFRR